jgi:serine protease Do
MNQIVKNVLALMVLGGSYPAMAQEDVKTTKKETQEIIIRKKGDKDVNVTVQVKGDEILVNGKPLAEYKGDDVTISKRKMHIITNGMNNMFKVDGNINDDIVINGMGNGNGFQFWNDDNGGKEEKYTFLGVTTSDDDAGAKITDVSEGSGADKAGLKEGDIIIKVGDKKIEGPNDLSEAIRAMKPKDEAKITYKRDGKENTTKAKLGEKVEKNVRIFSMSGPGGGQNWGQQDFNFNFPNGGGATTIPRMPRMPRVNMNGNFEGLGERMEELSLAFGRPKLGLKIQDVEEGEGVKIIDVEEETPVAKAGLKKDDIITEIDGKKISNTDDAREQLRPSEEKKSYSIKAKRNGSAMNFEVKVPKKIKTASF